MKRGINAAFDLVDVMPSPVFRSNLRSRFVEEMTRSDAPTNELSETEGERSTVTVVDAPSAKNRRPALIVGVAAAIIVAAVSTLVLFTRRDEPTAVVQQDDVEIAKSALLTQQQLGSGWATRADDPTTLRNMATIAAKIPACASYVDFAFAGPGADVVTAERDFQGELSPALSNIVYIFATEEEATEAMAKIAEPGFGPCFNQFIAALIGFGARVTTADSPSFHGHGQRQVVVSQEIAHPTEGTSTTISFFIQVGRGIVYVDPILRKSDPLDASGKLNAILEAATSALTAAVHG
ncbi:MAG TPA: hypothetical protein VFE86_08365 [Ilumatobacteraceae bacterium]|nr:hypothetical protein [Ilumatobacteraceae bacterium]